MKDNVQENLANNLAIKRVSHIFGHKKVGKKTAGYMKKIINGDSMWTSRTLGGAVLYINWRVSQHFSHDSFG